MVFGIYQFGLKITKLEKSQEHINSNIECLQECYSYMGLVFIWHHINMNSNQIE